MVDNLWHSLRERTMTWYRPGGAGFPWKLLDQGGAMVDAVTGGASDVEQRFGLDARGFSTYLTSAKTGDPAPYTTTLSIRPDISRLVAQMRLGSCPFDMVVLERCADIALLSYQVGLEYYDGNVTSYGFDNPLANLADNADNDIMRTLDTTFAPIQDVWAKLAHLDISKTVSDFAINRVLYVDREHCIGSCYDSASDGEQRWWAVTDKDNTPGYQAIATAKFLYTEDGGNNWSTSYINATPNGDAYDVVRVNIGGRETALVAVPTQGVAYAAFEDILNGVVNPWTLVTTGFTAPNYPNALYAVDSQTVYACGNNGYIYKSTDGGLSWTAIDAGASTTANLTAVSFSDSTTGVFVGASGAAVLYFNGTTTRVVVRTTVGGIAVSATFSTVALRPGNGDSVYIGTSTGLIYRSQGDNYRPTGNYPLFTSLSFPDSGNGSIKDIQFAGFNGSMMFVVQQNAGGAGRVLRDVSGGSTAAQYEIIGGYTSVGNFGINSIAPANINVAITGGEVHETYAFIGKLQPS